MEELYQKYAKQVFRYLYYLSHDRELAEELVQETFYIAIKQIAQFRGECKVEVWLCKIARNLYFKECKKQKKKTSIQVADLEGLERCQQEKGIEETYIEAEERKWLYEQIQMLDIPTREIVLLRIQADLSFKQIAEIVHKSENYVRVNFYRAKEKLKSNQEKRKDEGYENM
ncbi:MAG: RNA polymerase sigma factor [Clostridia bacterium]